MRPVNHDNLGLGAVMQTGEIQDSTHDTETLLHLWLPLAEPKPVIHKAMLFHSNEGLPDSAPVHRSNFTSLRERDRKTAFIMISIGADMSAF